jgi:transcriptional regulator with XRE-family HTH domain
MPNENDLKSKLEPILGPLKLKLHRAVSGYSQHHLGFRSGMSQGKISQIECGYRKPSTEDISRLADALNCRPEDITFPEFQGDKTYGKIT